MNKSRAFCCTQWGLNGWCRHEITLFFVWFLGIIALLDEFIINTYHAAGVSRRQTTWPKLHKQSKINLNILISWLYMESSWELHLNKIKPVLFKIRDNWLLKMSTFVKTKESCMVRPVAACLYYKQGILLDRLWSPPSIGIFPTYADLFTEMHLLSWNFKAIFEVSERSEL